MRFTQAFATSANPVGVDAGDGSEGVAENYSNLDPEESRTFEIGTKWDVLNERLNLTASVFRTEKQNTRIQLDAATYTNGGETQVDGLELGVNGQITDKWAVSAGYTYLDSETVNPIHPVTVKGYVHLTTLPKVSKCRMYLKILQPCGLPML